MTFTDRADAGRRLAAALAGRDLGDAVVLGLPRGGVPVAAEIARALGLPLDVLLVRKLGLPGHAELAMGAIGEDGVEVVNGDVVARAGVAPDGWSAVRSRERRELERRAALLRAHRPAEPLAGRTAIVVDDGVATGATTRAACEVARAKGARRVVLATPVAPREVVDRLATAVDEVVCLQRPADFGSVGQHYDDFRPTSEDDVVALLVAASEEVRMAAPSAVRAWHEIVRTKDVSRLGDLLADDVVFRSPAVFTPQEGKPVTTAYLTAAVAVLGPTLRYVHEWYDETSAILEFEAEVDGRFVHGIDKLEWNADGKLVRFTVLVRPLRGLEALIERMRAELG